MFLGDGAITEDEFVSGCKSDGSFLKVKITFCQFKFKRPQMEENLKNSLLPPGLAHYVLKPKERFEVCHQRFSPPGYGRPLPRLSMECKPLIEKQLWNSIVIFIWVHFFFWKKMHLQQHLLLLNHKNLSSSLVLDLWHFRTFKNNFFWSIPLVCRCSKVEIGFSEGQLPGSFGVLLSRWSYLIFVTKAMRILV